MVGTATASAGHIKLRLLKAISEERGLPYTSARDLVFAGKLRVFKSSASGSRYARWYVDEREFDQLIESGLAKFA